MRRVQDSLLAAPPVFIPVLVILNWEQLHDYFVLTAAALCSRPHQLSPAAMN